MASSRDGWASVDEYRTCVHHTAPIAADEMDCCDAHIRNLNGKRARHACEHAYDDLTAQSGMRPSALREGRMRSIREDGFGQRRLAARTVNARAA